MSNNSRIALVMGSDSDWPIMQEAAEILDEFKVRFEAQVLSAHRMPDEMADFAKQARANGFEVIIAGAGGAAHLPGMIASLTTLPVIGVPIPLKTLDGMDSLLSIVQMPAGIPVATVGIGNAKNAALLALRIIGAADISIATQLDGYAIKLHDLAIEKGRNLQTKRNQRTGF
ncbi:MAG: 5-(carboxyamino)imidazole ribonucleotide mutase [Actinomycetes bacterium]|jgi:5-(carboxyamino)imidazole ribonucleotide mutase